VKRNRKANSQPATTRLRNLLRRLNLRLPLGECAVGFGWSQIEKGIYEVNGGRAQMGLKEWIIPQDKAFFDVLEKESSNVLEGAKRLEEAVKSFDRMEERRREFKEIEHAGDEIVHDIYERVNRSFITPIDQEDLTKLASLYDDVLDYMYAVMNRLVLFEIKGPTESMVKFAGIVRASVEQIDGAFNSLRKLDKAQIEKNCIEVDSLENEADVLLNDSIAFLFKSQDVINILKLKEIYEHLETVTDRCEDLSFVIRDIMIKLS
jgi:predicted phosphate transport protein (TIGR00153 family)